MERQAVTVLVADSIGKRYGDRAVLTAASLRAVAGEVRVLFGRNGIGKSTLLKVAAGWMRADTGIVKVDGVLVESPSLAQLARRGVFYPPDHDLLTDAFTVRRQLTLLQAQWQGADVSEALVAAGVDTVADRAPGTLSGGELRRAEFAAAMVRRPRVLLADEPLRGVAPRDAEVLVGILRRLAADGCAVVVTGHEAPTLLAAADHVTWCTSGTTYELGSPAVARRHEGFVREYLGRWAG